MADDQAQGGPASYRAPGGPAPDEPTRGHPVKAMLGGILVLWLFLWIIIPNPKDQPIDPTTGATKTTPGVRMTAFADMRGQVCRGLRCAQALRGSG